MSKSRPQAPPVVDPNQLIQQDAAANRITQFSPYGNLLFGSVGDQGQFVQGEIPEDGQAAAFIHFKMQPTYLHFNHNYLVQEQGQQI